MVRQDNRNRNHIRNHTRNRPNKRNRRQTQGQRQGQGSTGTIGTARPTSPVRAAPTELAHSMENSPAPVYSNTNTQEAAQSTQAMAAQYPIPEYNPSLPLPPNPFSSLTSDQRLGFSSPADHIAQAAVSETSNASTILPLAGHTPAFIAAYTPLGPGENLFMLDPVADRARMMNIVSGFVRDGRTTPVPNRVNEEKVKKKGARRGTRGGVRHKKEGKTRKDAEGVVGRDARPTEMKDYTVFEDTQEFLLEELCEEGKHGDEDVAGLTTGRVSTFQQVYDEEKDANAHTIVRP